MPGCSFHDRKFVLHSAPVVAGAADIDSLVGIDMAGYEACAFIVSFGTITSGAATSIKIQMSSDNAVADAWADCEGTSITVLDTYDNKLVIAEIVNPQERYVRLFISRATQNSVVNLVLAELSGAGHKPVTQPTASVNTGAVRVSPIEGTA
jgi:hypothetical protein